MAIRDYFPFLAAPKPAPKPIKKPAQVLPPEHQKALGKVFKVGALALGFQGLPSSLSQRATFETSPYEFDKITAAIDTDSYVRQAFSKYQELLWKEGWDIVSENPEAENYLWQRIDYLEVAMNRSFQSFLVEVADQLVKYSNVFIAKARNDSLREFFPGPLYTPEGKSPIVGYYVIPTERVEILRDKHNKPRWYRQRLDDAGWGNDGGRGPVWNANDVIHLHWDKKPGRAFGTPFVISALDDVISLRQIEEDSINLVHRELAPLYKYMIGTDEHPATQAELEKAAFEIESLRVEGGIVLPHRHDVDVIGSEGKALDAGPYLTHWKHRVANGLGLYPHHLGMSEGGNREATDRLDIALYDKVKTYQTYLADEIRRTIFNELLIEGGFDPMSNPMVTESDRCYFAFNEIDVDTQVKKETHEMQKYNSNLTTSDEARLALKKSPELDESKTAAALMARMTPDTITQTKTAAGTPGAPKLVDTTPAAAKADTQKSSTGGRPNPKNLRRGAGNIIRPSNQHGRRTSPDIRHDLDEDWLTEVESLLSDGVDLEGDNKE